MRYPKTCLALLMVGAASVAGAEFGGPYTAAVLHRPVDAPGQVLTVADQEWLLSVLQSCEWRVPPSALPKPEMSVELLPEQGAQVVLTVYGSHLTRDDQASRRTCQVSSTVAFRLSRLGE